MKKTTLAYSILLVLSVAAMLVVLLSPPILQDEAYHQFSDAHTFWGIPHFWNVVSNLPFLAVGILGLLKAKLFTPKPLPYWMFFGGVALVSMGSGYYHFNPNSNTLIWDRMPMTLAFMALFSIIVSEFMDYSLGRRLLAPLSVLGLLSVLVWVALGDLRLYVLVQFYPMVAIPIILLLFQSEHNAKGYWLLLLAYLLAKVFEHFDHAIHNGLGIFSGHSLKHLMAALGIFLLLASYLKRRKNVPLA